jgi:23S rRNA pseudouridine1911/1915/1917 synthase
MERFRHPHSMIYGSIEQGGPIQEKLINGYSLVELKLDTGRTHQIRIHMASLGHPVVGDHLYCHGDPFEDRREYGDPRPPLTGEKGPRMETNPEILSDIIERQALHAASLEFVHPVTGEMIKLKAELPDDMKRAIDLIKDN